MANAKDGLENFVNGTLYISEESQLLNPPVDTAVVFKGNNTVIKNVNVNCTKIKQKPIQRRNIKNLIIISLGFFCLFTAFNPLQNLQSSLNAESGLGTLSLSIIYGTVIFSNLFLSSFVIQNIGCKSTIVVAILLYITYIIANFKSNWYTYTVIPASVMVGIAGAPLWAAQSIYVNEIGIQYANIVKQNSEKIIPWFFGIFFMIFRMSQICGNLIMSSILNTNKSENVSFELSKSCGKFFCPISSNYSKSNKNNVDEFKILLLCGVLLASAVIGCLIIFIFLDKLKIERRRTKMSFNLLLKTCNHMRSHRQKCLIPLTIYAGMLMAFVSGDYTQAFTSCSLGIHYVGYVIVCVGITCVTCSVGFGILIRYLALYGTFFVDNQEAAFSNRAVWESVGYVIVFAYNSYLCIKTKIYIILIISVISLITYSLAEYLNKRHVDSKSKLETYLEVNTRISHV